MGEGGCALLPIENWAPALVSFSTVLTQSPEIRAVMTSLQVFQGAYADVSQTVTMAASLIASLPTVVLFFALRKHFMQGLQVSSG